MLRATLCVFLALALLFLGAAVALHHWGGQWARTAYEPLLDEQVTAAFAQQRHGQAEGMLLQALHSSPAYALFVQQLAAHDLNVMPELRHALAGTPMGDAPEPPYLYFVGRVETEGLSAYKRALAEIAAGHSDAGFALLEGPATEPRAIPDAGFRLGQRHETAGDVDDALSCYARALTVSDAHLDAARAYLRLAGRSIAEP